MPKVSEFTVLTDPLPTDQLYALDDPGGVPSHRRVAISDILKLAWPVGSIYIAEVSTDPATLLGFGTWAAIGAGRVLVGQDTADTDFDVLGETGGTKTVTPSGTVSQPTFTGTPITDVINHTHPVTITDPGHTHSQGIRNTGTAGAAGVQGGSAANNATIANGVPSNTTGITAAAGNPTGGVASITPAGTVSQPTFTGAPASVVQPYLVVRMWRRTA